MTKRLACSVTRILTPAALCKVLQGLSLVNCKYIQDNFPFNDLFCHDQSAPGNGLAISSHTKQSIYLKAICSLLAARADIYAHFSRKCGESEKCSLFFQRLASFSAAAYFVQIMGFIKNSPFSTAGRRASTLLTFWQKHFIPGQESNTML